MQWLVMMHSRPKAERDDSYGHDAFAPKQGETIPSSQLTPRFYSLQDPQPL